MLTHAGTATLAQPPMTKIRSRAMIVIPYIGLDDDPSARDEHRDGCLPGAGGRAMSRWALPPTKAGFESQMSIRCPG